MAKHRIDFLDPSHHYGLNSTCRLRARDYVPGDTVLLYETGADDNSPHLIGRVAYVLITDFWRLDKKDTKYQHAKDTRTPTGLHAAMRRAYGDRFDSESIVTMVYYWVENPELPEDEE